MKSYDAAGGVKESTPTQANAWLKVAISTDGGETYSSVATVSDWWMPWPPSMTSVVPTLAVDPGSGAFKDRIYAVWPDDKSGRTDVLLAYSSDKGKTWSRPRRVNDDRQKADPADGPHTLLPVVAVNRQGVVGISWYDRRDVADNLGWWVRFSASLDGGDTFLPSTKVSEAAHQFTGKERWSVTANASGGGSQIETARSKTLTIGASINPFLYTGGHTAGLAADAGGRFHPFWVDNRTGISQVWTAPVSVAGTGVKNGSTDLSSLDDVTDQIEVRMEQAAFDRATGVFTMTARLRNTSKSPIAGPIKLRALTMTSALGVIEAADADNGVSGSGAIWDFTKQVSSSVLPPDAEAAPRTLTFRLRDLRPVRRGDQFTLSLVNVEARLFAKMEKKP
jgi:hypothetical protein